MELTEFMEGGGRRRKEGVEEDPLGFFHEF